MPAWYDVLRWAYVDNTNSMSVSRLHNTLMVLSHMCKFHARIRDPFSERYPQSVLMILQAAS